MDDVSFYIGRQFGVPLAENGRPAACVGEEEDAGIRIRFYLQSKKPFVVLGHEALISGLLIKPCSMKEFIYVDNNFPSTGGQVMPLPLSRVNVLFKSICGMNI